MSQQLTKIKITKMKIMLTVVAMLAVMVALLLVLALSALPAAANGFGPAFFCDAQAFSNCTDTSDPALAEDTFSCEGAVRDVGSCTNQASGESAPYCVFMGEDGGTNRDAYLCGPPQDFSNEVKGQFWYFVEAARQQVGFP